MPRGGGEARLYCAPADELAVPFSSFASSLASASLRGAPPVHKCSERGASGSSSSSVPATDACLATTLYSAYRPALPFSHIYPTPRPSDLHDPPAAISLRPSTTGLPSTSARPVTL